MTLLALVFQLGDLATFGLGIPNLLADTVREMNPLMNAAFFSLGYGGVAALKLASTALMLALCSYLPTTPRRVGLLIVAAIGAIGTFANLTANAGA